VQIILKNRYPNRNFYNLLPIFAPEMNLGKRHITIIGTLLTALFAWYWCSVSLFPHEHFVDGERIIHSHPFAGSSHNHSSSQLQVISFLSVFLALAITMGFALRRYDGGKSELDTDTTERIATHAICSLSLRAPPVAIL